MLVENRSYGPMVGFVHTGISSELIPVDMDVGGVDESNSTEHELDVHALYEHSHAPYLLFFIFAAVLIGVVIRCFKSRLPLPYTVIITLLGMIMGGISATTQKPMSNYTAMTVMDPHWVLQIFLPILIYESTFTLDIQIFKKFVGHIVLLATGGLAVAAGLTAVVSKFLFGEGWDYLSSLMFGALVSATDPVAVVALLKELGAAPELGVVLEGESLLNDGTAIILFNVFLALSIPNDDFDGESLALENVWMVAGGPFVGFVVGKISSFAIGLISHDAVSQACIMISTSFLTFYAAENFFKVSGVLAVVALGLVVNSHRTAIRPESEPEIHAFWESITYIANTIIFAFVGMVISERALTSFSQTDWLHLLCLYLALTGIRFISIVVFYPLIRFGFINGTTDWRNMLILSWGGLRGAVSLCLALTVSRDPRINQSVIGEKILLQTSGIVMLTLIFNGTTTAQLLRLMGLDRVPDEVKETAGHLLAYVSRKRFDTVEELSTDYFLGDVNWDDIVYRTTLPNPYKEENKTKKRDLQIATINALFKRFAVKHKEANENEDGRGHVLSEEHYEYVRVLWLRLLKRSIWDQFSEGTISRRSYSYLTERVDNALAEPGAMIEAPTIVSKWRVGHKLRYCQKLMRKVIGHEKQNVMPRNTSTDSILSKTQKAEVIVSSMWFTVIVYITIFIHVTGSIANLARNWHGRHIDDNFFHESVYYVVANGVFLLIYIIEIMLSISGFGFREYARNWWNRLELFVVLVLSIDFCLDISVLAFGEGQSAVHKTFVRIFDVLSLLRILRAIRLVNLLLPAMGKLIESMVTHRQVSGFEIGKSFLLGQKEATDRTREIVQVDEALNRVNTAAQRAQRKVWEDLALLLAERPDIAKAVKKRFAARKVMHSVQMEIKQLVEEGVLDEKTYQYWQKIVHHRMARVSALPYRTPTPAQLLEHIPWIQGNPQLRAFLLSKAIKTKFTPGTRMITEGQEPPGIFIMMSGIVKEQKVDGTGDLQLSAIEHSKKDECVTCGDVIGEFLVLSSTYSCVTYYCHTAARALLIPKEHIEQAFQSFKHLRPLLWEIWSYRIAFKLLKEESEFHHTSTEIIKRKLSNGFSIIIEDTEFAINPEWETVVLVNGSGLAFPDGINVDAPLVIPKSVKALRFNQIQLVQSQPVAFIVNREREHDSVEGDRHDKASSAVQN